MDMDKLAALLIGGIVLTGFLAYSYILVFRTDQYLEWERERWDRWGFDVGGSKNGLRFVGVIFFFAAIFISSALFKLAMSGKPVSAGDLEPNGFAGWVGLGFGVCGFIVSAQLLFPEKTIALGDRPLLERWQAGSTSRTVAGLLLLLGSSGLVIASAMLFFGGKIS